mmetsp:Transcript_20743/g.31978  ORF Transcript_20743/g.31978 Transcript_20743/m.31978 type:complete len:282 (+) Transcript_20743:4222-5067(+)
MLVDLLDLTLEVVELSLPLALVLLTEHVSGEAFQLTHLVLNLLGLLIDLLGRTRDSLEVGAENGEELLDDNASLFEVFKDTAHINGGAENFLGFLEVPALDGLLAFDVTTSGVELLLPLLEDHLALLDDLDGVFGLLLEDLGDVDLSFHLVADFVRDALEDIFHLLLVLVDVSRDGPDQLQARKQRGQGLLDHLQLPAGDVLELTVQGGKELHEVLGLGVQLLELAILGLVVVEAVAVLLEGVALHDRDDFADLRHVQLLVQRVESSSPLPPVFGLALRRF